MISLTFGLFTQVSGSGPLGPLVFVSAVLSSLVLIALGITKDLHIGPVVQSIVSLTRSVSGQLIKSFTIL